MHDAHDGFISIVFDNKEIMTIFIVVEDYFNSEYTNVACFGTEKEAEEFCDRKNKNSVGRFYYEGWEVGEVLEEYKDEGTYTKGN